MQFFFSNMSGTVMLFYNRTLMLQTMPGKIRRETFYKAMYSSLCLPIALLASKEPVHS